MTTDYTPGYWINDDVRTFMSRGYLRDGQSVEERIDDIAFTVQSYFEIEGLEENVKEALLKGWVSLSSPVWANFGTDKGLPISCNGSYIADTTEDILIKTAEIGMQTKYGAGTSAYLGALRPRGSPISTGGRTDGPVHFMGLLESTTDIISQSSVRRGSCAVYLDINHPDILEFLEAREEGSPIQNLSLGVCVPDYWMQDMIEGDPEKRKVWARVLRKRFETGYPYLFFSDTVDSLKPQVYKDLGLTIHASNLCSEITLPSSENESFVCCLASLNILHYDEWRESGVVETLVYILDAVLSEYIEKTSAIPLMSTAHKFAVNHRAIGIGWLGWHSYLQRNMIPFESMEAKYKNVEISRYIEKAGREASERLLRINGPCGLGNVRHTTLFSIAPTTSSSFILGQVSPSVEPENSNYYTKDLAKGKFTYRNPFLKELLVQKNKDTDDVWRSILLKGGSVQHLEFLSKEEKETFKTFGEISQAEIIIQASQRQKYIDQSQSINLMIHPNTPLKDVNELMIKAWELGLKTLYYQRSTNPAQEYSRELVNCQSCEA